MEIAFILIVYRVVSVAALFRVGTLCLLLGLYVQRYAQETAPLRSLVAGCAITLGALMTLAVCALVIWFLRSGNLT